MYNIALGIENGGARVLDQPTFNSIQPRTRFQLQTTTPGRIYYEVKQIGDVAYPLAKHKNKLIPRLERLLFEQQVFPRPSAQFKNRNRLTYCLNDVFVPTEPGSSDGMIVLDGTPPFKLELSIKDISASQTELRTVEVFSHHWNVNLPSYMFKSIGPHLVNVESVVDSSSCAQATLDPLHSSIWVDVAENAAIIPFDRRIDYCVGEVTQFQLEGIPPWSITSVGFFLNMANLHESDLPIRQVSHQRQDIYARSQDVAILASPAAAWRVCDHVHCAPAKDVQGIRDGFAFAYPFAALCSGWRWKEDISGYT